MHRIGLLPPLLDALIELNRQARPDFSCFSYRPAAHDYAAQYATVRLDIGRQTGKTWYIRHRATRHDIILTHSRHWKKAYAGSGAKVVCSLGELRKAADRAYLTIWIDEPKGGGWRLEEVYRHLSRDPAQTFVILGE